MDSATVIEQAGVDFGDDVDEASFEQILDMDEGEDGDGPHDFSKSIVFGFFDQAQTTFTKMDAAMTKKDYEELSALGHFLKGSSATLGFTMIKDECEKIQHYGHLKDESGTNEIKPEKAFKLIEKCIEEAKKACKRVEEIMQRFYERCN